MKKVVVALILVAGAWLTSRSGLLQPSGFTSASVSAPSGPTATSENAGVILARAYDAQQSNVQVEGQGVVSKVLSDDNQGSRHQRFLVRLDSGQTLLVAHNIDLAPRIESLKAGDTVGFYGEYEWNSKGGVIHWTHRDPQGRHVNGWLEHNGRRYE